MGLTGSGKELGFEGKGAVWEELGILVLCWRLEVGGESAMAQRVGVRAWDGDPRLTEKEQRINGGSATSGLEVG